MKNEYDQQLSELEDENGNLVEDYNDREHVCYCGATEATAMGSVIFRSPGGEEKETWDECCECVNSRPSTDEHCNECGASQATSDPNVYLSGEHAGGMGGDGFSTLEEACRASLCPRYAYSVNEPHCECSDCGSKLVKEHRKAHYEKGLRADVRYHSPEECEVLGCEDMWLHPDGSDAFECACSFIETVEEEEDPEPEPEPENCMICNRELTTERARGIKIGPYCEKNLTKRTLHINSNPSDEDLMVILGDFDFAIDWKGLVFKTTRPPYLVRVPLDKETWSQAIPIEKRDAKELLELIGLGDMEYYDATNEIGEAIIEQLLYMTGLKKKRYDKEKYRSAIVDGNEKHWVIRDIATVCNGSAHTNNLELSHDLLLSEEYYKDCVQHSWAHCFMDGARDSFEENCTAIYEMDLMTQLISEAIVGSKEDLHGHYSKLFWQIRPILIELMHDDGHMEVFGQDIIEFNIEWMMGHGEIGGEIHPYVGGDVIKDHDGKKWNEEFYNGLKGKEKSGIYSLAESMETIDRNQLEVNLVFDMIELVKGREEYGGQ